MFRFSMYSESHVQDKQTGVVRRIGEDAHPVVTESMRRFRISSRARILDRQKRNGLGRR